ncbi:UDP-N-acetylglucosamine--N-acetylmuramyl-pyrophosphoryl-undecaprenol N-acetylglucosamine transferase isoform 3 [Gossypium australe]|uniref:UDP-N-acetylglucosamine--N-acetylmuramyl-pyrophosphoryl-undecaprenol N-acetylglucosamine transferase isoform 3 n=1 Tax=Gossypium australe TaxID=47621 RepID=A0A5B6X415_9ROSI|nr:UDP-N-acetylglucosamine--N-acetylmuramyl-pyrophosphoryl-undecaprenol N-acetylglucosamine transferase isoform 3 [Gossypium australe]
MHSIQLLHFFSFVLIWKYEGFHKSNENGDETQQDRVGFLDEDETWRPCLKGIHPAWLLAFRLVAFFVLLILLIVTAFVLLMEAAFSTIILRSKSPDLSKNQPHYTKVNLFLNHFGVFLILCRWTFTLITFYFGLGSLLSIRGCYQYHKSVSGDRVDNVELDAEQGNHAAVATACGETSSNIAEKNINPEHPQVHFVRRRADTWGYVFQMIFQMNAGAVLLTDCVFWFIIVPFLAIKDYNLSVLAINMHTINAVFLLGDTALNCLVFGIEARMTDQMKASNSSSDKETTIPTPSVSD